MSFRKTIGFILSVCILHLAGCVQNVSKPAETKKLEPGRKIKIVLVGDSTVTDKAGWGAGFKRFIIADKAECINTAAGGRSSKSFIN